MNPTAKILIVFAAAVAAGVLVMRFIESRTTPTENRRLTPPRNEIHETDLRTTSQGTPPTRYVERAASGKLELNAANGFNVELTRGA